MELKSPSSSLSWILGNFLSFLTLLLGRQPHRMSDFVTHMSTFIFVTKFFHFFGNWTACRYPPFLSRLQRNIGMTMKSKSCVLSTHESGCTLYSKMASLLRFNAMAIQPYGTEPMFEAISRKVKPHIKDTANSEQWTSVLAFIRTVEILFQRFPIFQILWCGTRPRELIRIKAQVRNLHPSTVPETLHWDLWGGEIIIIISLKLNARRFSSLQFEFCTQTLLQLCDFPYLFLVLELALIEHDSIWDHNIELSDF